MRYGLVRLTDRGDLKSSLRPRHIAKVAKEEIKKMNDKDKSSNRSHENIVEHPQLKRDRALALFLARSHARRNGKPPPDPANIGPAVFTKLSPEMSREQMVENLIATLERNGIKVNRNKENEKEEKNYDT